MTTQADRLGDDTDEAGAVLSSPELAEGVSKGRSASDAPRLAAALWDMDGTLVDTEPYWIEVEKDLVATYGGVWTDELAHQCVGNPLLVSAQVIRDNSPVDLPPEQIVQVLLDGVSERMRAHVPWRPGALALLESLVAQGIPCALVTMSYTSFAQVLVDNLPPGTLTALITGDRVEHGKPHPEPYLSGAAALGAAPRDCIAFEDSPPGVQSAVAAGVPTIAVPHIVPVPALDGSVEVPTLEGITIADVRDLHRRIVRGRPNV